MMLTPQRLRHGLALALCAAALPGLAACGDDDDDGGGTTDGTTETTGRGGGSTTEDRTTERGGGAVGGADTTERGGGEPGEPGETTERGGGSDEGGGTTGGAGGAELRIAATEQDGLGWSRRRLTASVGSVTITMDNPSGNQLPHAVEIEGGGVEEESNTVEPGRSAEVTADLRAGTYTFYCPVGDHRAQGMEGTLTVR